jgi:hypothetical protein
MSSSGRSRLSLFDECRRARRLAERVTGDWGIPCRSRLAIRGGRRKRHRRHLHIDGIPARSDDVGRRLWPAGVDSERKRELAPALLERSKLVVDVLAQCAVFGDLHHGSRPAMTSDDATQSWARWCGLRPGRESPEEVIVFDSTGMALQDVAAAALVYERALDSHRGTMVNFQL